MTAQKILDIQTRKIIDAVSPVVATYYKDTLLDLDALCNKLNISLFQGAFEDKNISGFLSKDSDKWSIVVNEEHSPVRRRFTIAHELGHYFAIMHDSISTIDYLADNNNVIRDYYVLNRSEDVDDQDYQMERQANMIAAEILMPEKMVQALIDENFTLSELACKFGVSESAMSYRLTSLKIKTLETLF